MYDIFTYIYNKNQPNVGKYTIHGWYGIMCFYLKQLKHDTFYMSASETCRIFAKRKNKSLQLQYLVFFSPPVMDFLNLHITQPITRHNQIHQTRRQFSSPAYPPNSFKKNPGPGATWDILLVISQCYRTSIPKDCFFPLTQRIIQLDQWETP